MIYVGGQQQQQHGKASMIQGLISTHLFMFDDRMVIYTYLVDSATSSNTHLALPFVLHFHLVACPHMSQAEVYGSGFNWHIMRLKLKSGTIVIALHQLQGYMSRLYYGKSLWRGAIQQAPWLPRILLPNGIPSINNNKE